MDATAISRIPPFHEKSCIDLIGKNMTISKDFLKDLTPESGGAILGVIFQFFQLK